MKTKEQIKDMMVFFETIYKDDAPEYIRGAYDTLEWILEDEKEETK